LLPSNRYGFHSNVTTHDPRIISNASLSKAKKAPSEKGKARPGGRDNLMQISGIDFLIQRQMEPLVQPVNRVKIFLA
jgi:hypothetical protein